MGHNFFSLESKTWDPTMQITSFTTIVFSTFISSSLCGRYYKYQQKTKSAPQQSIPEIVSTNPNFSTLLAAVSAAGLVEALSAEGPFTVFAPTNKAFAKIPSDALTAVLARHVIAGSKILSGDIPQGVTKVQTLGGEEVEVIRSGYSVSIKSAAGSARVIKA